MPPPASLDWDLWCGPAPLRPFNGGDPRDTTKGAGNRGIHPRGFRNYLDYANGTLGDWGVHWFDQLYWWTDELHPKRVYSMGHSNGAAFSYVLWQARPDVLAAVGSVAGSLTIKARDLKPLPVIHVAGENDPLVKFAWQQATFAAVRRFNACSDEGKPYAKEGVLEVSEALVHSALNRTESRGAHAREDYPERDDENWLKHTLAYKVEDGKVCFRYKPVVLGRFEPKPRTY